MIALSVIIASVALWLSLRDTHLRHKGRTLQSWMSSYASTENDLEAQEAIRSIGTNAFPVLLRWIRGPEPKRPDWHHRIAGWLPRPLRPEWAEAHYTSRPVLSSYAFRAFGTQACTVIPELLVIAANTTNSEVAVTVYWALSYMGSNGVPALLAVLGDHSHPHRGRAAHILGYTENLGFYTNAVVTELIARLNDPSIGQYAAVALGKLKAQPELAVPALAGCLNTTNGSSQLRIVAAASLVRFDEKAVPALPHLTNALNDPNPAVRQNVAEAIKQIHYRSRPKEESRRSLR
jgi:HEAT repeat protein